MKDTLVPEKLFCSLKENNIPNDSIMGNIVPIIQIRTNNLQRSNGIFTHMIIVGQ